MFPAFTHRKKSSGPLMYTSRSSITPPSGWHIGEYSTRPGYILATSFVTRAFRNEAEPAPLTSNSPMWLTSNSPAARLTALCSSRMLRYCTGISQPAKSTSLAPCARWKSLSGVRLRSAIAPT